ncbi:MAG: peptide MFS transporter [Alistipes sp.]|nr:peptide MFS transporter [Alistipes sp.]
MFKGHPKGLYALALANTGERFGYYTMLAVFALFLRENFGLEAGTAGAIYSTFLGLVYFMPLVGGIMADKFGFGRMVTIGITIMFGGYLLLSVPLGGDTLAMAVMMVALLLISLGTGLFKGNLQVMVGNLYDDPKYADKRDSGFSLFYMAINVGSLFAPTTAVGIKEWAQESLGFSSNDAYHFAFMVACIALVLSIGIYYAFRSTFRHVEGGKRQTGAAAKVEDNLSPAETKQRIIALCLVFAVVIFFWMAFHQNGLTLTYFADEFTNTEAFGVQSMLFDVWNLAIIIVAVYATFSIFQSESAKGKLISGGLASALLAFLVYRAMGVSDTDVVDTPAPIFQQFNPFYVVALTPVSMAIFGALARKGKEPSAPRKIAYGMLVAAIGFVVMAFGSTNLNTPDDQQRAIAVNKAKEFAAKCYLQAPTAEDLKNIEDVDELEGVAEEVKDDVKDAQDFMGKLNSKTEPVFYAVYDAQVVLIENGIDPNAPVAEEAPVVEETVAVDAVEEVVVADAPVAVDVVAVEETVAVDAVEEAAVVDEVACENEVAIMAAQATLKDIEATTKPETRTTAYWLIFTYLILTFAELLLSPMGISFVSKVAPPKYKGMMMGGWFVATAIGNLLVAVGGFLWAGLPLWSVWAVFVVLCLLSALFMFVMMKRLENATK